MNTLANKKQKPGGGQHISPAANLTMPKAGLAYQELSGPIVQIPSAEVCLNSILNRVRSKCFCPYLCVAVVTCRFAAQNDTSGSRLVSLYQYYQERKLCQKQDSADSPACIAIGGLLVPSTYSFECMLTNALPIRSGLLRSNP